MSSEIHQEGTVSLLPVTTVAAFPVNTFVENIAVRPSGQLLVTVHNKCEVVHVDPHSSATPSTVYVFPTGVCGIVEGQPDIFYVSSGTIGEKGSWAIYKVDMTPFAADTDGTVKTPAITSKFVDVPDALFLNGSARLSATPGTILLADSVLGAVYAVDVNSAAPTAKLWLQDDALAKLDGIPLPTALNGIKFHQGYLYMSNTNAKKFFRVKVTPSGEPSGPIEVVAEKLNIDDFAFDSEGAVYLATHFFQSIVKLASDGTRMRVAGGPEDAVVAGTTAAAFGRTEKDRTVLYVTTTGGMSHPVGGKIGPGRVLKIEVGKMET